ncbi:MAG: hypothetical protein V1660_04245 [archaeon]
MTRIGSSYEQGVKRVLKCYLEGDYEISIGNNTCYLHPKNCINKNNEMVKIKVLALQDNEKRADITEELYFICRKGIERLANSYKPKIKELVFA